MSFMVIQLLLNTNLDSLAITTIFGFMTSSVTDLKKPSLSALIQHGEQTTVTQLSSAFNFTAQLMDQKSKAMVLCHCLPTISSVSPLTERLEVSVIMDLPKKTLKLLV